MKPATPEGIQTKYNAVVFRYGRVCENGISYRRLCELLSPYELETLLLEHRVAAGPIEVVLVVRTRGHNTITGRAYMDKPTCEEIPPGFRPMTAGGMMQMCTCMFDVAYTQKLLKAIKEAGPGAMLVHDEIQVLKPRTIKEGKLDGKTT